MRRSVAALFLIALPAMAQQDLSNVTIESLQLSPRIHMLQGAGGNIGVLTSSRGLLVIDDQYAPLTSKILAALRTISDEPVRFVINTHWHGDHTGGNENMGATGAVIVAHENVRERMSTEQFNELWNRTTPPSPDAALPVITFADSVTFHADGEEVRVIHMANAHTDGDSIVYFRDSNVLHTGDLFFNGSFPYIDTSSGGSLDGLIAAGDRILEIANDATKIIPGHGAVATLGDYRHYHTMLTEVRERLTTHRDAGLTLEQVLEAKPLDDLAGTWGKGFINAETMIRIVYPQLGGAR